MKKQLVLLFFVLGIYTQLSAQKFSYDVDFTTYFDNREYHSALQPSQTIFGTRLSPEIGVLFNDSLGGTHKMMAGVSYIQPFGAQWQAANQTWAYATIFTSIHLLGSIFQIKHR